MLGSAFTPKVTNDRRKSTEAKDRASVYDIQPQAWVFENSRLRSAVFLQGEAETLAHASYRTFIKRGIAWAARRTNVDELCTPKDLVDMRYPVGGPSRAEKAIAAFQMQPGFKAGVVVTEPLINKPIAVQWDERGRLWVAESPEYPNGRRPLTAESWREGGVLVPGSYDRPAQDKISVLVDTDGDGVADIPLLPEPALLPFLGRVDADRLALGGALAALYLLSDLGSGTTGENLHVDAGYHAVGMKAVDAPDIDVVTAKAQKGEA